jgi:hypothetical protein
MKSVPAVTVPLVLALLGGCATSGSATGEAAKPEPTPKAEAPPVDPRLVDAPSPALAPGALLSYDARGAFGPFLFTHMDIHRDGVTTCVRRPVQGDDAAGSLTLPPEEVTALQDLLARSKLAQARQVKRPGIVMDVGTTTLSAQVGEEPVSLVVDGTRNVDPSPAELMVSLDGVLRRCLGPSPSGENP